MKSAAQSSATPSRNGWRKARLAEVCELNPRRPILGRDDDAPTTFVSMSAVEEDGGGISGAVDRPFREVKKGYTYFAEGDVLFAKITPCMQNGKHAVARNLRDGVGFGSTEFHVIRPSRAVIPEWLHYFLLQPEVLRRAEAHFTGAVGQQRVPDRFLADLDFPVPPLMEQRRIAALLNHELALVERARRAIGVGLAACSSLKDACALALFSPRQGKPWPVELLGKICRLVNGDAYRDKDWSTEGVRIVRIQNLNDPEKGFNHWAGDLSDRVVIDSGDVLLAWSGTPGTSFGAHLWSRGRAVLNQHIFRVDLDRSRVDPAWAVAAINEQLGEMIGRAHGAVGLRHVTKGKVETLPIPLPDLQTQRTEMGALQAKLEVVKRMRDRLCGAVKELEGLRRACLRTAFNGDT